LLLRGIYEEISEIKKKIANLYPKKGKRQNNTWGTDQGSGEGTNDAMRTPQVWFLCKPGVKDESKGTKEVLIRLVRILRQ
jgi:hypothetical protein